MKGSGVVRTKAAEGGSVKRLEALRVFRGGTKGNLWVVASSD